MTMKNQRVQECRGRKEFAMLFLQMKEGEYLTIGEDIVIQVFPDSSTTARLGIKAPKEITILRGEVRERNGCRRPNGLVGPAKDRTLVSNG